MSNNGDADKLSAGEAARWRFGDVVVDERTMELTVKGQKVELARKPFDLLMFLVRNPGEVVTKEELFEAVWAGRIVTEGTLTTAIGRLRTALGDESSQQLIKVVYGYGYRFMAEVIREDARAAALPLPVPALDFRDGDTVPLRTGWRLNRRLGTGGGGDVWLATEVATRDARVFKFARDHTALTALKREITLSRLMRESLGERPDFVRVLDWNLDEAPYFIAVDHCSEGSLADWAEANGGIAAMPLAQRLELMAQVAEALATAHSVGVLHKDLKPSNLLLHGTSKDGALQIRLSDFGSARLIDQGRLSSLNIAQLGFTQTVIVDGSTGTPLYLAPELLAGNPPTIRSDVYALGVVLYQLVVGDLRRSLAPGWEQRIDDPLLIEDIAAAAAGDPQRRLGDAAELALRLRSLTARRQTRERERIAAREAADALAALERNRARRGLRMALAATLVVGLATTITLYFRADQARVAAQASAALALSEAERANAVTRFLTDDLLSAANPVLAGRRDVSMRDVLGHARQQLDTAFKDQPRVRATLERVIGGAYAAMGQREETEQLLSAAEQHLTELLGPAAHETQLARLAARNLYVNLLDYPNAVRWSQRILTAEQAAGNPNPEIGSDAEAALTVVGCFRQYSSDFVSRCTEPTHAQFLKIRDRFGPDSPATLLAQLYYGIALSRNERYAEAIPDLEQAYQGNRRILGGDNNIWLYQSLGVRNHALAYGGRAAEAKVELDKEIALRERIDGPENRLLIAARRGRAQANLELGNAPAALAELQDILAIATRNPAISVENQVAIIGGIVLTLRRLDRLPQAEAAARDGLARIAPREQPSGYWTLRLREQQAAIRVSQGDIAGAERLLRQNLQEATGLYVKGEWLLGWNQFLLGDLLWSSGRHDEARPLLVSAQPIALGENDERTRRAQAALAQAGS